MERQSSTFVVYVKKKEKESFMAVTNKISTRTKKPDLSPLLYGKMPPQASDLENAVLGAVMLEPQKLAEVLEIIQSEDC